MRFSLIPREYKFFDMFDEVAVILTRASQHFLSMVTEFDKIHERSAEIKKDEHDCDDVVEKVIRALDQSFITPFDREDIHTLATKLDDVLDNMEETAHRLEVFRVDRPPESAVDFARIIHDCCNHIAKAVTLLRNMKNMDAIHVHLLEVGRLENEADKIYRNCESALFANPPEILLMIKWRELYAWLEETVDACKSVANIISEIVIKGS